MKSATNSEADVIVISCAKRDPEGQAATEIRTDQAAAAQLMAAQMRACQAARGTARVSGARVTLLSGR